MNTVLRLFVLTATVYATIALADDNNFTAPDSAAEKALDALLQWHLALNNEANNEYDFLTQRPDRNTADDTLFTQKFTHGLVAAIAAEEKRLVQETCGGEYLDEEICGLDFDPILCAQDFPTPPFSYFTSHEDANSAFILSRSGDSGDGHRVDYLLEKEQGIWKIAGVACGDMKFNIR